MYMLGFPTFRLFPAPLTNAERCLNVSPGVSACFFLARVLNAMYSNDSDETFDIETFQFSNISGQIWEILIGKAVRFFPTSTLSI